MNETMEPKPPTPVSPVRDDSMLGRTEDLDRKPGGFPHRSIAGTALLALASAALVFALLFRFSWFVAFLVAAFIAICIVTIRRSGQRGRSKLHPSV